MSIHPPLSDKAFGKRHNLSDDVKALGTKPKRFRLLRIASLLLCKIGLHRYRQERFQWDTIPDGPVVLLKARCTRCLRWRDQQ